MRSIGYSGATLDVLGYTADETVQEPARSRESGRNVEQTQEPLLLGHVALTD